MGQCVQSPCLTPTLANGAPGLPRLGFQVLTPGLPRIDGMSDHKFRVGQNVHCSLPFSDNPRAAYKILQLLPADAEEFQYRIKNADEPHERVVKEHQLSPAWDTRR